MLGKKGFGAVEEVVEALENGHGRVEITLDFGLADGGVAFREEDGATIVQDFFDFFFTFMN